MSSEKVSLFDLEKLAQLLRDFYEITHIRITVFDEKREELLSYPAGVAPYCEIIRRSAKGLSACTACDRAACEAARKKHGTYIYRCHAGFTEAVTPLYIGEILCGYLLFGHVFSHISHEAGWREIAERTAGLQVDQRMLRDAVMDARYIPEEMVRASAHILRAVASYVIMERMASLRQNRIAVRLDTYLAEHFTENITVETLCGEFNIGKTQLYKVCRQLYGTSVQQRVRDLRIELAKRLLVSPEGLTVAEIAEKCGYNDYNYFITVFSRAAGQPPGAYRKSHSP